MRVLLINDYFFPSEVGGAEVSVQALSERLSQEGVEIEILTRYPASAEPPPQGGPFRVHFVPYRESGNPLFGIWERDYFSPMRMATRLTSLLSSGRYDIIHAHNLTSAIAVLMAKRAGTPLPPSVLTVRSYCHLCPLGHGLHFRNGGLLRCGPLRTARCLWEENPPSIKGTAGLLPFAASALALHRLAREAVQCFDRYVCISSFVDRAMQVSLGIDSAAVETIPEFLNTAHLRSSKGVSAEDSPFKTILYVGRLVKEKGLPTLLEAFERVVQQDRNLRLVIVGEGGLRAHLEEWVSGHRLDDRIVFVGPVKHNEVVTYFERADMVVVPSRWPEPLGIVVLEALFLGKPVIATAQGGILDIIQDRVNGLLVPSDDPLALAQAMDLLLSDADLRGRLQENGPATIAEKFDPRTLALRTLELYRQVMDSGTSDLHPAIPASMIEDAA